MDDRSSLARNAGLLVVAFLATLILLAGLALGVGGRVPGSSSGPTTAAGESVFAPPATTPVPPRSGQLLTPAPPPSEPSLDPSGDPVLVGAGDIASCSLDGDEATARLLDGISGTVFTAGDNAYEDGTAANYEDCYAPTWGRHKDRTRPVPGNHDYATKDAAGYRDYFGDAATNADGKTWYSYDLGTWHIVALDSNCSHVDGCGPDSEQGRWLARDLAASAATCTLAIWHHPRFSSGFHGNSNRVVPFWEALYTAGADVIVNGHDHDYERFAPQDPAGVEDRQRGLREFVVGTGGAALRDFESNAANSELRLAVSPGVIKLTLRDGAYDWAWLPTTGPVSDSGSGPCH